MAAIFYPTTEGTRFDYYNALEARAYKVHQIFKQSKHPKTILMTILGENPGFRVGQKVSYRNSKVAFTGDVWYIWKGPSGFNLYVRPANYSSISAALGGEVVAGEFPSVTSPIPPLLPSSTNQVKTVAKIPVLSKTAGLDPFAVATASPKEIASKLAGPDPVAEQRASSLLTSVNNRTVVIGLVVVVAGILLLRRKK